ncbi:MAG: SDR family oxidoreductase [Myxococcota bacterium]|nr:SDR family oxidoreductase [Myxococcota bacterium]
MRLEGKAYLVTGSSTGIGKATTQNLLREGARVVGVARREVEVTKDENYVHIRFDLSHVEKIPELIEKVWNLEPDICGVIDCAGAGVFGSIEEFSLVQIQRYLEFNLIYHAILARYILPRFKKAGCGDWLWVGSESALRAGKFGSLYSAAKFGVRGMLQSLRAECAGSGIRIMMVHPGMVRTPFFDDLRFEPGPSEEHALEADDVADSLLTMLTQNSRVWTDELMLNARHHVVKKSK